MLVKYLRALLKSAFRHERKLNFDARIFKPIAINGKTQIVSPVDGKMFVMAHKASVDTTSYLWTMYKDDVYTGNYDLITKDAATVGTAILDVERGQTITLYGYQNLDGVQIIFTPFID